MAKNPIAFIPFWAPWKGPLPKMLEAGSLGVVEAIRESVEVNF